MLGIILNGSEPIYEQLAKHIEKLVLSGILEPNESLPSVRELATDLTVNPNTIQKAYTILEQQGVTYSVGGKGRFVTNDIIMLKEKKKKSEFDKLGKILLSLKKVGFSKEEILNYTNNFLKAGENSD